MSSVWMNASPQMFQEDFADETTYRESVSGDWSTVPGRYRDLTAVRLVKGKLDLDFGEVSESESLVAEFWVRFDPLPAPEAGKVEIARIKAEPADWALTWNVPQRAVLISVGDETVGRMPVSTWHDTFAHRKGGTVARAWHHLALGLQDGTVRVAVDGFEVPLKRTAPVGELKGLEVEANQTPIQVTDITARARVLPEGDALRRYFRTGYNREPEILDTTVTVPFIPQLDQTDDPRVLLTEKGSRIAFTSISGNNLFTDSPAGYIGYTDTAFYLYIETPYEGELDALDHGRHQAPLWGEESYEIFLHPPLTGVPDYAQLVGNPYGNRADLRVFDGSWTGDWEWKAERKDGVWTGLLVAPFALLDFPNPGEFSLWTMNIFGTKGNSVWAWTRGAYHNTDAFGPLIFKQGAPSLRPSDFQVHDDRLEVTVDYSALGQAVELEAVLQFYSPGAVFATEEDQVVLSLGANDNGSLRLSIPVAADTEGTGVLQISDSSGVLYNRSFLLPATQAPVRTGRSEVATASARDAGELPYRTEWTAEELGETMLEIPLWQGNDLGKVTTPPAPWTPLEYEEEGKVNVWNRTFVQRNHLFAEQIFSEGEPLLAGTPRLRLDTGDGEIIFSDAEVTLVSHTETEAILRAVSSKDGVTVAVTSEYTFDGMVKTTLDIRSNDPERVFQGISFEIPLQAEKSDNFHIIAAYSGHPPATDSGAVAEDGFSLDRLRHIIWLGDMKSGLTWFTESMENWPLWDEKGIQRLSAVTEGQRVFSVKIGDRPFRIDNRLELVFGLQATPTRPQPENFRKLSDRSSIAFPWYRGDGHYVPWHENPEPSRQDILANRAEGREVMPVSSLRYYGPYNFYENSFYQLEHPGMKRREVVLFGDIWAMTGHHGNVSLPTLDEDQVAPPGWWEQRFRPAKTTDFCPHSSFQDYYIWKLHTLIEETDVGAWYLDNPLIRCSNPLHHCGYVNYKGEWEATARIFAMREMVMRIYQLLYAKHGSAHIRWHSSNQIIIPALSFADVFWDGENYLYGQLRVGEFYSKTLSPERVRVQHSGKQFGFAPDLLPEFGKTEAVRRRSAPSPASVRDMMGLFMVHDSTVYPIWSNHNDLISRIQNQRLRFPFDDARDIYYWQSQDELKVEGDALFIAHTTGEEALLVLFNSSDEIAEVQVSWSPEFLKGHIGPVRLTDYYLDSILGDIPGESFSIEVAPRDFLMLHLERGSP